ncbi:hypothetical protein CANARDRAFT_28894 [[Candida] arabinofermentans NRRL YB-2248]|uniref:Uncharacterized protein n=1 Tax=[Candida] arabinofermentans NRRL YB-2248 TaxID=983967 RepID=A0A1E4SZ14_9ASCO|nr:hypothetical protein CANARDRAFT_28894 [[Candida] arabinofermentans NRRL YB-2248]
MYHVLVMALRKIQTVMDSVDAPDEIIYLYDQYTITTLEALMAVEYPHLWYQIDAVLQADVLLNNNGKPIDLDRVMGIIQQNGDSLVQARPVTNVEMVSLMDMTDSLLFV